MPRTLVSLLFAALLPTAVAAQHAGVLLGFDDGSTLWVAPDARGYVRALRSDSLLIVPRDDGFWKVGTSSAASARPSRRAASRRSRPTDCYELEYNPGWSELSLWASPLLARPRLRPLSDSIAELGIGCGTYEIDVTFIGPGYISLDEHFSNEYGPGMMNFEERTSLMPFDSLARRGSTGLFDERWNQPIVPNDRATQARLFDECRGSHSAEMMDALAAAGGERSYLIRRAPGRWQLVMHLDPGGPEWRGMVVECGTEYRLPDAVVGHDALPMSWDAIRQQVPGARDAVGSPDGDMVVVLAGGKLLVYAPRGERLGAVVAQSPVPPGDLVMVQWATGPHVARWSTQLAPYFVAEADRRRNGSGR